MQASVQVCKSLNSIFKSLNAYLCDKNKLLLVVKVKGETALWAGNIQSLLLNSRHFILFGNKVCKAVLCDGTAVHRAANPWCCPWCCRFSVLSMVLDVISNAM